MVGWAAINAFNLSSPRACREPLIQISMQRDMRQRLYPTGTEIPASARKHRPAGSKEASEPPKFGTRYVRGQTDLAPPKPFQPSLTTLVLAAALGGASPAWAQVAGGTTIENVTVTAMTQFALGWGVKKTLLGKTIYNDAGGEVGKVDDLIISPDRNIPYVIVGAGGFIGIGRHGVATG